MYLFSLKSKKFEILPSIMSAGGAGPLESVLTTVSDDVLLIFLSLLDVTDLLICTQAS